MIVDIENSIKSYIGDDLIWVDSITSPAELFLRVNQGVWLDPSDLSTMFQDVAGTVPVTKDGDPVALIKDKSGNGNHAMQSVNTKRPVYKTDGALHWLQFDGVDDFLIVSTLNMSNYPDLNIFTAAKRTSNAAQMVAELSKFSNGTSGSFYFVAGTDGGRTGWVSMSRGSAGVSITQLTGISTTAPETSVLSVYHNIPKSLSTIRRNQVSGVNATGNKGTGNFGNYDLYIGARGGTSIFFDSNLYGMIISGGEANLGDVTSIEQHLAAKAGVSL